MRPSPFVRPDVQAVLDGLAAGNRSTLGSLDAPATRAVYAAMRDASDFEIDDLAVVRDIEAAGAVGAIPLRLCDARAERTMGPVHRRRRRTWRDSWRTSD